MSRDVLGDHSKRQPVQHHRVLVAAGLFAVAALILQAWRSQVLLASYDQGIFQQVLWNSLQGHPFESTLSSQLSASVGQAGELPSVDYERLGQHFTFDIVEQGLGGFIVRDILAAEDMAITHPRL